MSEPQKKKFVITRFDPDQDEVPKTQEYETKSTAAFRTAGRAGWPSVAAVG